jgi:hypothetical protein
MCMERGCSATYPKLTVKSCRVFRARKPGRPIQLGARLPFREPPGLVIRLIKDHVEMASKSRMKKKLACPACKSMIKKLQLHEHLANCKNVLAIRGPWITTPCRGCYKPIHIHLDWESPLVLCKPCTRNWVSEQRRRLRAIHAEENAANQLRGRPPNSGYPIQGGLPGLGRRR